MVRTLAVLVVICGMGWAQKLDVKSATRSKVSLTWSGAGQSWIVERKSGPAFQKIADVTTPAYDDAAITPFGTYTYRVRAGATAAPSNEVTVGPPPAGVNVPSHLPAGVEAGKYGTSTALTFDENGDP